MKQTTGKTGRIGYEVLTIVMAMFWGGAFVFQKTAMEHTGPWLFLALSFALSIPSLAALVFIFESNYILKNWRKVIRYSILPGITFASTSLFLQVALVSSYASKASLVEGLYVCIIPFAAYLFGYKLKTMEIAAGFCALLGLYFLTIRDGFSIGVIDILLIGSAFGTAGNILALDYSTRYVKPYSLALFQSLVCVVIFNTILPFVEPQSISAMLQDIPGFIYNLWFELLFCGILTAGIAVPMFIYVHKFLEPSRVGLLTSTEVLFAVIGGWLILGETLDYRELIGGLLMISSILIIRIKLPSINDTNSRKSGAR